MEPGARADITFLFYFLNQEQGRTTEEGKRRRRERERANQGVQPHAGHSPTADAAGRPRSGHLRGRREGGSALAGAGRPPSCLLLPPVGQPVPRGSSSPSRLVVRSPLLGKPGQSRAQPGPEQERHSHARRPSGQQRRLAFTLRARSLLSPPGGRTSNAGDAASRASGPSVGLSPALDSRACPWEGGLSL